MTLRNRHRSRALSALASASIVTPIAATIVLGLAGEAFARAPQGLQTIEELQAAARVAAAEAARNKTEAAKDPNKEAIEGYLSKKLALADWAKLVQIVLDAKSPELQDLRQPAADALLGRFAKEDTEKDPKVRAVRSAIALELCELLKAPASDAKGLEIANAIFHTWYRAPFINSGWKPDAKLRDRQGAYNKIKKFLKDKD